MSEKITKRSKSVQDLETQLELAAAQMASSYDLPLESERAMHLRDYWRAVRKRLWLIIGITVLFTTVVAIYMARQPDIYAARARVQVDLENNPGRGAVSKGGQVILGTGVNDPIYFNTQPQILEGPGLLRRVVKTLDLEHNQEFRRPQIATQRSTWESLLKMFGFASRPLAMSADVPLGPDTIAAGSNRDDPGAAERLAPYVEALQAGLRVEPVKFTRLIDITYRHLDPTIATKVVNTVADIFVLSNLEKKVDSNATEGDFLQKRIAELQAQIRNGEERLVNYAKNNQIVSLDGAQNTVVERLVGLNQQLLQAENERQVTQAAYQAALAPGAADALTRESANQFTQKEQALADLRMKRALLLVKTTEEWPEVKEIDQQIAELEQQIQKSRTEAKSVLITNLKTRYQQSLAREQALRTAFNEQRGETLTQNAAAINYRMLQQEVETNRSLFNGLLQRSKENDVIVAGAGNNIHVVDYAVKPVRPLGFNRLLSVLMALFISLGFGVALALFLEYLDDTVHSEQDVEKLLRLPTLAIIPSLQSLRKRGLLPAKYASRNGNGNGNGHTASGLVITKDARSPLAEAYRQLRTSLLLSGVEGPPRTILVTSSLPSEGKTTTVVNLAIALAQGGADVLIIDADMRRPRLHTTFGMDNKRGLSTIVASQGLAAEADAIVQQDLETRIHVLTSGPMPPNPADHLGSDKMRSLLSIFSSSFTHIIIDSPPLASFTDGVLLSSMVDNVIFVVQGGKGSKEIVLRERRLLQDVGANVTGVVLNNVTLRPHERYFYGRYYQGPHANGAAAVDPLAPDTLGLRS